MHVEQGLELVARLLEKSNDAEVVPPHRSGFHHHSQALSPMTLAVSFAPTRLFPLVAREGKM